jgi:hypothetical protein
MNTSPSDVLFFDRGKGIRQQNRLKALFVSSCFLCLAAPMVRADSKPSEPEDLPAKIVAREHQLRVRLAEFHPLVETEVRVLKASHGEMSPWYNRDFVGVASFRGGLQVSRLKTHEAEMWRDVREYADSFNPMTLEYNPAGFVAMAYPDSNTFDLQHYRFQYSKTEDLGDLRCLVFDVYPVAARKKGLFRGKIWVEDQSLNIIRFNGMYDGSNISSKYVHFDSWRANLESDVWVPAVIYSGEEALPCCGVWKLNWAKIHFRAETRFWGYALPRDTGNAPLRVASKLALSSPSAPSAGPEVIEQSQIFEQRSKDELVEQLERLGMLSPPGEEQLFRNP